MSEDVHMSLVKMLRLGPQTRLLSGLSQLGTGGRQFRAAQTQHRVTPPLGFVPQNWRPAVRTIAWRLVALRRGGGGRL